MRAPSPGSGSGDAAAAGAASALPRSASVPALSEQPQRAGAQCSLHSPSDWRSRRSPCLLLSGSQVRERSQLLSLRCSGIAPRTERCAPAQESPQTRSDWKLLWQLPERNVLFERHSGSPPLQFLPAQMLS